MSALRQLEEHGQSIWMDYIRRSLIETGELKRMIEEDGLKGLTSNPSIFQKAISGSSDYDAFLQSLASERGLDAKGMYERLAIRDIRDAADLMHPVYDSTDGRDGLVSLEVSPDLAYDTEATCEEARRLWRQVDRENVMIKVPATEEGLPAIAQLISEGLNINVTLLFARSVYERVVEAYLRGLERLVESGGDPSRTASVASFFVSRIDAKIDDIVERRLEDGSDGAQRSELRDLQGKVAIANAKLAYQRYHELFSGPRWEELEEKGARTQRLLWASTSTKNPSFRDTLYVEELVGPETVTTVPPSTYDAVRDHGEITRTLDKDVEEARATLDNLPELDISLDDITDELVEEGVQKFADSFKELLETVERDCEGPIATRLQRHSHSLPEDLAASVNSTLAEWKEGGVARRLWSRDASLWTGEDEADWLGWLGVTEDQLETDPRRFRRIAELVREEGFSHVLVLGMGGSSLCPDVLASAFGKIEGFPLLHVLDSTDPGQVKSFEKKIDLADTLFIVSSKSGTTLETTILKQYFFDRVASEIGEAEAGRRFVAITDPGSALQVEAEEDGFRRVFFGVPSIGGRYSALSDFGMVPAAAMGLDVKKLLDRAEEMVHACASCVPADRNPGVVLGVILGVLGGSGRNKVTLVASPEIRDFGAWLEQLLAESTGKEGIALIPVEGERPGTPDVYGDDRLFVYLRLEHEADGDQDVAIERLEAAGHPVVRIQLEDRYDLGGEFFRWEFATAVAGSILGINPFNQPDVEASKRAAKRLTEEYERTGELPGEAAIVEDGDLELFADDSNRAALAKTAGRDGSVEDYLRAHLDRIEAGDYFATLAYIEMSEAHREELQRIRHRVRDARRVATCLGFGPRFLHSTGQAYKGGPDSGVFLQITCDDAEDLPVPGRDYTFGIVKAAQARGDLDVLAERGRRALRVNMGHDVAAGLARLREIVEEALA
jgi:transaldolase/glucose-6-phosphate isomerase